MVDVALGEPLHDLREPPGRPAGSPRGLRQLGVAGATVLAQDGRVGVQRIREQLSGRLEHEQPLGEPDRVGLRLLGSGDVKRLGAGQRRPDHARRVVHVLALRLDRGGELLGERDDLVGVAAHQPALERIEGCIEALGVRPGVVPAHVLPDEGRVIDGCCERFRRFVRLGGDVELQTVT